LSDYLGGTNVAGGLLKETGYVHWWSPNEGATNVYGFSALGSGYRDTDGGTGNVHMMGAWWSSTEYDPPTRARSVSMHYEFESLGIGLSFQNSGQSVRCIKD
jgi:uncharacterized protein (TIGR02145 family)